MNTQYIDIFYINEIKSVFGKVQEFDRFIEITRIFSGRCHVHIQNLIMMVNSLIDSEDNLGVNINALKINQCTTHVSTKGHMTTKVPERSSAKIIAQLTETIQEEQKRMIYALKNGQKTSQSIKNILETLLEKLYGNKKPAHNAQHHFKLTENVFERAHQNHKEKMAQVELENVYYTSSLSIKNSKAKRPHRSISLHRPLCSSNQAFSIMKHINNIRREENNLIDDYDSPTNNSSIIDGKNPYYVTETSTSMNSSAPKNTLKVGLHTCRNAERSDRSRSTSNQLNKTVNYAKDLVYDRVRTVRAQSRKKEMPLGGRLNLPGIVQRSFGESMEEL